MVQDCYSLQNLVQ